MSNSFQRQKWNIQSETEGSSGVRVISQGEGSTYQVEEYIAEKLKTSSMSTPEDKSIKHSFQLNRLQGQLKAEQEKAKIVFDQEIDVIKKAAFDEGMKQGFGQGHGEGIEAGKAEGHQKYLMEMRGNIAKIEELTAAYEGAKNEIYAANERVLVQLAFQVAKKVVLKELATDETYIQRVVKEIIDRLSVKESVRIKVSPKDLYRVENIKKELTDHFSKLKNITVESSDKVLSGCIVETDFNVIDAQVENQLKEIFDALVESK
ncbi:MAG: hypothetical protein KA715_06385 [Xanthomonadaceae bacterium]|nr:hypothetical protein [Xanthomonadaceae bacterium]